MKKLFTIISLLAMSYLAQATTISVSNTAGQGAMFSNLQTAIDSAHVGDTVFVFASATTYGNIKIYKRIVLLGPGGSPDWNGACASIGIVTIDTLNRQSPNGTVLNGIKTLECQVRNSIQSTIVKGCYLGYSNIGIMGTGHIITNCYIENFIMLGTNIFFSNNYVMYGNNINSIGSGTNCIISNNIFNYYINVNSSTIINNIFLGESNIIGTGNTYKNNIEINTNLPAGNYSSQTLANTFSETGIQKYLNGSPALTKAFTLKAGSPGIKGGTDGKDVGVNGGNYPWPIGKPLTGDPGFPQIVNFEVINAVVAPGGSLKINLKAKSNSVK